MLSVMDWLEQVPYVAWVPDQWGLRVIFAVQVLEGNQDVYWLHHGGVREEGSIGLMQPID